MAAGFLLARGPDEGAAECILPRRENRAQKRYKALNKRGNSGSWPSSFLAIAACRVGDGVNRGSLVQVLGPAGRHAVQPAREMPPRESNSEPPHPISPPVLPPVLPPAWQPTLRTVSNIACNSPYIISSTISSTISSIVSYIITSNITSNIPIYYPRLQPQFLPLLPTNSTRVSSDITD